MPFLKKFQTVFNRLIISHITVVVLLSFSIGFVTTTYFTKVLEGQIRTTDSQLMLRITDGVQQQAYEKADKIWVKTVRSNELVNRFFVTPSSLNAVDLYNIYEELQVLKNQDNKLIYDIQMYSKELNIFISATQGVKYIGENDEVHPYSAFETVVESGIIRSGWILPEQGEKNVTLFRTYPYIKHMGIPFKGYLAISLKNEYVNSLIQLDNDYKDNEIIVVDKNNMILNSTQPENIGSVVKDDFINNINTNDEEVFFDTFKIKGKKCFVSSCNISGSDLKAIRIVPFNAYYKQISTLHKINSIICIIFAIIGLVLSFYLVKAIYTPLSNIIKNIKNMFSKSSEQDEYSIISDTITNLVTKVNVLEYNIETNISLIKDNIISTLLTDHDRRMLKGRLSLINPPFEFENYIAIIITLSNLKVEEVGIKKFEYYKYDLITYIENSSDENTILKSASVGAKNIGIILNSKTNDKNLLLDFLSDMQNYLSKKHDITPYIGVGDWVFKIEDINDSYVKAENALKYIYIYPERNLFIIDNYLQKDFSEISMDKSSIVVFYNALKSENIDNVKSSLDALLDEVRNSDCSYSGCEYKISDFVNAFVKFTLEQNINIKLIEPDNIYLKIQEIENINEFETWMLEKAVVLFDIRANKTIVDNSITIEKAIKVIEENLNKDISLSLVADKVYITAPYLSKMFKKETGMNFNAYVTEKRLETAKDLLLSTNLSVNQITEKVGFNSATYLIRRFKERYGDTPANYKKMNTNEDTSL